MGRMKDAILESQLPDAVVAFDQIVEAVRDCYATGNEDFEGAVVAALVLLGTPAELIAEGTRERGLVIQVAKNINVALLSFGALRCATETFRRGAAAQPVPA